MVILQVLVPDLGDFKDVPVLDVLVKAGDVVKAEDPLVALESDKATMEIPSPAAGVVRELKVKKGDKLSQGSLVLLLEVAGEAAVPTAPPASAPPPVASPTPVAPAAAKPPPGVSTSTAAGVPAAPGAAPEAAAVPPPLLSIPPPPALDAEAFRAAHAGPGIRAFARELGVDLSKVKGSGPKGRILREDVVAFVKTVMTAPAPAPVAAGSAGGSGAGLELLPWPKVDFAKFGPIESKSLSRIRKIAGRALHRNWVQIPHVTNHDDADVTDVEAFRVKINQETEKAEGKAGTKVTLLAFVIKAVVAALQKYPDFNSSLEGESLVVKHYWHIGFAADTPSGLLVPVIKDADRKGILAIAKETAELATKAREGKLAPSDMQGATFSISSLGGIGGTYFTPIINAPEVAILGLCRAAMRPVWDGEKFNPRLILPLSLSWDHRVVDGASAARFNAFLAGLLADARRLVL